MLLYVVQAGIYAEVYNNDGATMIDGMECQWKKLEKQRQKNPQNVSKNKS